jgi:phage gp45-like
MQWLKRVVLSSWADGPNPTATSLGRLNEEHDVEVIQPFGISYQPPVGAEAIAMPVNGSHDHLVAVGFSGGKGRPSAQAGELVLYSSKAGHTVKLRPDGSTRIETGGGWFEITASGVNTNLTINTTGDVIAGGVSLRNHRHGGVDTGPNQTTPPV